MARKKACDSCHSKKIHCDGGEPRCEWCAYRNLECTYSRPVRKKTKTASDTERRSPEDLEDQIEQRIFRLEGLLGGKVRRAYAAETADPVSKYTPVQDIFYGSLHFAGFNLGDISSQVGIPKFSEDGLRWIQERTGDATLFEGVYTRPGGQCPYSTAPKQRASKFAGVEFPSMGLTVTCFNVYLASPLRRIFPIIDTDSFEETIRQAYEVNGVRDAGAYLAARTCVLAFLSQAAMLEPEKTGIPFVDSEAYALEAHDSLIHAVAASPLQGLQAAISLCLHHDFVGNIKEASVAHGLAVRCVYRLGGQLSPKGPRPRSDHKQVRELFWLCYFFDKHISLRTGQPSAISDVECDLSLHEYRGLEAVKDSNETLYPSDMRLTVIKSKVASMLYSPSSFYKSDSQLLRDVRELDDELEAWRLSVPEHCRPRLAVGDASNASELMGQHDFGMLVTFCHLEYLYLISAIHRACGRCAAWTEDADPVAVSTSLALSVQASRSTLIYFGAATKHVHREAFWMVVFYPLWATLTIFCNILHEPMHNFVASDIEMLGSIPRMIQNMHKRPLNPNEMCHLEMLENFVREMVRLADLAILRSPAASQSGMSAMSH